MLLKLCAILVVNILSTQCRKPKLINRNFESRIVGGEKATKFYPYQLSLQISESDKNHHMCGAVILSENHFLTAAHCIKDQNISQLSVLAGTSSLKEEGKGSRHPIDSCLVHPEYIKLNTSDIALCKLKLPFVFSEKIGKVNLDRGFIGGKVNCTLTGWGSVRMFRWLPIPFYSFFAYPEDLQQGYFQTITNDDCIKKGIQVDETQICAFTQFGKGACAGDSGGPLVKDNTLVGVVSFGTAICAIGQADVYSRVSYFYNWINTKMSLALASSSTNPVIQSIIANIPEILQSVG